MSKASYVTTAVISTLVGSLGGIKIATEYLCKPTSAYVQRLDDNRRVLEITDVNGHTHALLESAVSDSLNPNFQSLDGIQREQKALVEQKLEKRID